MYETTISRHWLLSRAGWWSLRDSDLWALWFPQLTALSEFPSHGIERENPAEAWQMPWIEERELRVLEIRWLEFTGKERATKKENPRDLLRLLFNKGSANAYDVTNYLRAGRKTIWTDERKTVPHIHSGPCIGPTPRQTGKPHNSEVIE